jgi:GNAT superfamily N-acetyltransferase
MADFKIRAATDVDVPALVPLMRAYCEFYDANPADAGLDEMAHALVAAADSEGMLLVGELGGVVEGFAACGWKWSSLRGARIVVLEDLFVSPQARGRGIADALIEACAERARALGAPAITWLTAPDNHRAQAVYNRVGGRAESMIEYELDFSS